MHCGSFIMLVDEIGAICNPPKPVNDVASALYPGSDFGDMIHGVAIIGKQGFYDGELDIVGLAPSDPIMLQAFWHAIGVL